MKKTFLLLGIILLTFKAECQLLNPGFEILDSLGEAKQWGQDGMIAIPIDSNCLWIGADSMRFTSSDAHTGNHSYELRVSTYCSNAYGGKIKAIRFTPDTFADQRILFTDRPASFTFYYKLFPLQGDKGMATLVLEDQSSATVGNGLLELQQQASGWTLATIPITYYSQDTPAFLTLKFALVNDTLPHYGSRFVIDDINSVPAETKEINGNTQKMLKCYPIPAGNVLSVELPYSRQEEEFIITITDGCGKTIKQLIQHAGGLLQVKIEELPAGVYFLRLQSATRALQGKFVK